MDRAPPIPATDPCVGRINPPARHHIHSLAEYIRGAGIDSAPFHPLGEYPWHHASMGFLKRLFGASSDPATDDPPAPPETSADIEGDERARELDLARSEQDRLSDLQQRQLKYADYAWQPPAQGGTRRADDEDAAKEDD